MNDVVQVALSLAGLILLGGVVAWLGLVALTVRTLTRPPRRSATWALAKDRPTTPAELRTPAEFSTWTFRSRGAELEAWDIKGRLSAGPTVVMTHGWGESRVMMLQEAQHVLERCARLILWDLPGHGDAGGTFTLGQLEHEDLIALVERVASKDSPAVLMGSSLGAGVSIAAAAARPELVAGVIAEAPYCLARTPARNVLDQSGLPWRSNLSAALGWVGWRIGTRWRGFDRAEVASRVRCPLVVVHGDLDAVCPLADGETIARAAPKGRLAVVPGGAHLDLWSEPTFTARALGAVDGLLSEVSGARVGP
ncbi:MAG: alpha/beta hydrolase [Planctomycetota bacterium]|nr:alpha/beta hydrolase [Planctomycetota bacterium]